MIDEFDYLVKSAIEGLEDVPNVVFEEEKVWKQLESKLPGSKFGPYNYLMLIYDIVGVGLLLLVSIFNSSPSFVSARKTPFAEKVRVHQEKVVIDNVIGIEKGELITNHLESLVPKTTRKKAKDTIKIQEIPMPAALESFPNDSFESIAIEKTELRTKEEKVSFNKATVHIYRPRRYVGSGLVFKLKANGVLIDKVRNGKHDTLQLKSGQTQFTIGKQKLDTNLKPNETYYVRVKYVGFPIGKPHLEWIAKEFAEKELAKLDGNLSH